ncbi:serine hydrolase [Agrococcus sp. ProA11]|uniref:serine hydrolase domain-containing protein n=1 Tax=Agrococcus chionoecetis TaxID=3153752 RepID=UPI0032618D74
MTETIPGAAAHLARPPRYPGEQPGALTLDSWQEAPHNRWAFSHVEQLVPTMPISRQRPEEEAPSMGLDHLSGVPAVLERLTDSCTDALVVVHRGRVVAEHFAPGRRRSDRHLLMSVSKSLCGLVVGTLVDDGLLRTDQRVDSIVPDLVGSAYGSATVQQVLDMTADVDYAEDYDDQDSEVRVQDRVAGWLSARPGDPLDTYAFLSGLAGTQEHGSRWRYLSAGTDVLAWIVETVTGQRYADAVADRLWSGLGADRDALVTVDRGGFAFANGGISCTVRDLARVGELVLGGGVIHGERIVSAAWIDRTVTGGDADAAAGSAYQQVHPAGRYSQQWWVTGNERGNVYASGIHGQYVWIDPPTETVIAKVSSLPVPITIAWNRAHAELFTDICAALERR